MTPPEPSDPSLSVGLDLNRADIAKLDTQKLHAEILQLRQQQFTLATVALAGSGISAWIVPGVAMLGGASKLPLAVLLVATLLWLVLLFVLYFWSLGTRRMISILSAYLKTRRISMWEQDLDRFHQDAELESRYSGRRLYRSPTVYLLFINIVYGGLVALGAIVAIWADIVELTWLQIVWWKWVATALLLAMVAAYFGGITWCFFRSCGDRPFPAAYAGPRKVPVGSTWVQEVWKRVLRSSSPTSNGPPGETDTGGGDDATAEKR